MREGDESTSDESISQAHLSPWQRVVANITLPARVAGSIVKVPVRRALRGAKRPTWNLALETAVAALRSAAANAPRDVELLRLAADLSIPGPLLPAGVRPNLS